MSAPGFPLSPPPPNCYDGDASLGGLCMGLLFVGPHNMFPAHGIVHYTRCMGGFVSAVVGDQGSMRA